MKTHNTCRNDILIVSLLLLVGCSQQVIPTCHNETLIQNVTIYKEINNTIIREVPVEKIVYQDKEVPDQACNQKLNICYAQTDSYRTAWNECLVENQTQFADNLSEAYTDCIKDNERYLDILHNISYYVHLE